MQRMDIGRTAQNIRYIGRSGIPIDLLDAVTESNHIAARGFSSRAGWVFSKFCPVRPQQQPSLVLQACDCFGVEVCFNLHNLLYVHLGRIVRFGAGFSPARIIGFLNNESNGDVATTIPRSLCRIDHFYSSDCHIINDHEGQEAYHQKGTGDPLPDLWCGAGREVRTQHGTAPYRAAS